MLVEAAPFLGAGVRTSWFGGHPYTFGPRHFLTQNTKVYEYLNAIIPLRSLRRSRVHHLRRARQCVLQLSDTL